MNKLFLYHANCNDGFASVIIAHRALEMRSGNAGGQLAGLGPVFYEAVSYGEEPHFLSEEGGLDLSETTVYLLDFSFKRDYLCEIAERANSMVILDHHKSAEEELVNLPDNVNCVFDMEKSGAGLTWSFYYPAREMPLGLQMIQDRDLWKFELADTAAFHAGVSLLSKDLDNRDAVNEWRNALFRGKEEFYVQHGQIVQQYRQACVNRHINAWQADGCPLASVSDDGKQVPCINVSDKDIVSEVGDQMCKLGYDYVILYSKHGDRTRFSLRSRSPEYDVAKIAQKYGGGGHAQAAGFSVLEGEEY